MVNIARWTMAHRRLVVVAWIVAAVGIFAVSSSVGKKTASSFTLPGTGSQPLPVRKREMALRALLKPRSEPSPHVPALT